MFPVFFFFLTKPYAFHGVVFESVQVFEEHNTGQI